MRPKGDVMVRGMIFPCAARGRLRTAFLPVVNRVVRRDVSRWRTVILVPRKGLEPPQYRYRQDLNLVRLPIPPPGQHQPAILRFGHFIVKEASPYA